MSASAMAPRLPGGPDGAASALEDAVLAFGALEHAIAVLDGDGAVRTCNAAWETWHEAVFGESATTGTLLSSLPQPRTTWKWCRHYLAHHEAADGTWLNMTTGDARHWRLRVSRHAAGRIVALIEETTETHRREHEHRRAAERFRAFAETSGDWFWELDESLCYRIRTAAGRNGADEDGLVGIHFIERLRSLALEPGEVDAIARSMASREPFRDCEVRLRNEDGSERVTSLSGVPFSGSNGRFRGYRGTGRNVTEALGLARRLAYQASHDDLTGLANRRALETRITELIDAGGEHAGSYALCYLDVDQIKVINDTCGHTAGDTLLNRLARMLRDGLRSADTVARLGGDEFAVLVRDDEPSQALAIAEKIRYSASRRPFTWQGQQFRVTVSIGVAPLSSDMREAEELMRAADSACYAAKERGRNRVKLYALDDATLNLRQGEMHWVARIHAALAEDRFELYLQPIAPVCGDASRHRHYEVLLRMNGRDGRQFSPAAFLPAAERYNLASQVDSWVLAETLKWLDRSPLFLDHLHTLAVNLSGQSLGEPAFLSHVEEHVRLHPHAAHKLCFEITETAAISNLEGLQKFMRSVRNFGCTFALDDFGAGLSSFAYLRTLDVDYLKIDGMFVKDCHEDPVHKAMVRSINEVGHVMGKKTIAEFVENDDVRETLAGIGIDYVQGYSIGKPQPFADVV